MRLISRHLVVCVDLWYLNRLKWVSGYAGHAWRLTSVKKALFLTIITILMSIGSIGSNAADNPKQVLLKQINQLQIITYDTTSSFLSYTLEDNKTPYNTTSYYAESNIASKQGDKLSADIDIAVAALAIKTAQPIQTLWMAYEKILNNEKLPLVAPGGMLDTFNIQELVKARNALIAELDVIRKTAEVGADPIEILALSQARKIKEVAMTYTAKASSAQGTYMAIDPKFDIKAAAHNISNGFDTLLAQTSENPEQTKLLQDAKTDWAFLMPVLSSDKKIDASSVVTIYSDTITKLLNNL